VDRRGRSQSLSGREANGDVVPSDKKGRSSLSGREANGDVVPSDSLSCPHSNGDVEAFEANNEWSRIISEFPPTLTYTNNQNYTSKTRRGQQKYEKRVEQGETFYWGVVVRDLR
jgi:hypothetical protein